jgi:hypothetical protein
MKAKEELQPIIDKISSDKSPVGMDAVYVHALILDKLEQIGVELLPGPFKDFLDPWGNRIELVDYSGIQFTKAEHVLDGMGLSGLEKTQEAIDELTDKGMAPK